MSMHSPRISGTQADFASLALILAVGGVIYGWIASYDTSISSFSDPMDYLFMADFYREYLRGPVSEATAVYYRATRFPPVFPLLLATFGAGIQNQHLASIISNATAVVAAASIWFWVRNELGRCQATLIALALLFYPAYFLLNLYPVSEPLGIMSLGISLTLLTGQRLTHNRIITAALVIGLAPLVRTALLPLIPAFVIWLLLRRPPLHWRVIVSATAITVVPFAAWTAYRTSLNSQSYTDSLSMAMLIKGWGGWPDALWLQPTRLFRHMVENWGVHPNALTVTTTIVLLLLAAAGCLLRIRDNHIDAWFLAGYMAMILIWPYPDEFGRFLVVVYPLLLVSASTAISRAARFLQDRRPGLAITVPRAFVMFIAFAGMPAALHYLHRATLPVETAVLGDKREEAFFVSETDEQAMATLEFYARLREAAKSTREIVGDKDCVYAVFPQFLSLHGRVNVSEYPINLDPAASAEKILTECNYYFISGFNPVQTQQPPLFPHKALDGWTDPLFISRYVLSDGRTITAAALARRKQ